MLPNTFPIEPSPDFSDEQHHAWYDRILAYPDLRVRLARDLDGQAIGYTMIAPIYGDAPPTFIDHPFLGAALRDFLTPAEQAVLPRTAAETNVYYLVQMAHTTVMPEAVACALWRDVFGVLALGGAYVVTGIQPAHKERLGARLRALAPPRTQPLGPERAQRGIRAGSAADRPGSLDRGDHGRSPPAARSAARRARARTA